MGTMEILLIVFGFIVGLVVLFTLVTVVRDMLRENREVRRTEAERKVVADQKALIERTRLEAEQLEAEKALARAKMPNACVCETSDAEPVVVCANNDEAIKAIAGEVAEIKAMLENQKCVTAVVEETPAVEEAPVVEEVAQTAEEEKPDVAFNTNAKDTHDEKFFALSDEQKAYYNEIASYASSKEDAKRFKNLRYEEFKIGKSRLVRMLIKRNQLVCEFIMYNSDFKNYVNENKVSVKQAATIIKITDSNAVQAAKDSMDIVVNTINEEKEYKKQQAKERRKAARLAKNS